MARHDRAVARGIAAGLTVRAGVGFSTGSTGAATTMADLRVFNCLVRGGAGWIGSHVARLLREQGARVTIVDNFDWGHRRAVGDARLVEADVGDRATPAALLEGERFGARLHFAGPRWNRGDLPVLVADNRRILASLDWHPERDDLDRILASAWAWEQRLRAMRRQIGA
mgnify:CR=1 FL=1